VLIVLEGVDGSGKSTHARWLAERLGGRVQAFPDRRTPVGGLIDAWLQGRLKVTLEGEPWDRSGALPGLQGDYSAQLSALVHQALQVANRAELYASLLSADARGALICDRFWQSGVAYGTADGLQAVHIAGMSRFLPMPAVNILLDVPVELAVRRVLERLAQSDAPGGSARLTFYERRLEKLRAAAEAYRELWVSEQSLDPNGWVIINGSGSVEATQSQLLQALGDVA
jgi:thymidylate kinase